MEVIAEGKYLRLVRRGTWECAERVTNSGAAVIVAITDENKILLTEQFRPPVEQNVIEFPAGLIGDRTDDPGEKAEDAAKRELEEETGYRAQHVEPLIDGPVSPGMSNETVSFFLATGLERIGPGGGDASEDIRIHEIPLADVESWLATRAAEGMAIDPKIYAGLYFVNRDPV